MSEFEVSIAIDPHPLLALCILEARFPRSLGSLTSPPWLGALLEPLAASDPGGKAPVSPSKAPLSSSDALRQAIRDLLRHGGYKPTGRGKPSSEYLLRAVDEGALRSVNLVVDLVNAVSLHSGIPISVVDLDLVQPPLSVRLGRPGERYVFNPSGQEIDVAGLLCLADAGGPCANGVKDAQRTKTRPETQRVLVLLWGCRSHEEHSRRAGEWMGELLRQAGAEVRSFP